MIVFFGHSKPSDANKLLSGFVDEMKVFKPRDAAAMFETFIVIVQPVIEAPPRLPDVMLIAGVETH